MPRIEALRTYFRGVGEMKDDHAISDTLLVASRFWSIQLIVAVNPKPASSGATALVVADLLA